MNKHLEPQAPEIGVRGSEELVGSTYIWQGGESRMGSRLSQPQVYPNLSSQGPGAAFRASKSQHLP